ncbi:MAG: sigma-70 family RNA polymerase sigma factor [Alphaproteobacteria bacterium]|nr:sigma-70 family RNA polymerase sigma factor [Alphaproteobacteria bacterium]
MPTPTTPPDLVRAAAAGDPAAWDRLLTAWLPVVIGWCRRLGGPDMDAEDLAHDTFLKVFDRLGQLRDPVAFPAWLYQATRDTIRKRRARSARWGRVLALLPRPAPLRPHLPDPHAGTLMLRLLQELPDAQREVVVLCVVEERTREEAAVLLDVPVGTVKSRMRLGMTRLRTLAEEVGLITELEEVVAWRR